MKNKYISVNDLFKIIDNELEFIDTLNNEIKHIKKRINYLNVLQNYLIESDFCPIIRRKVIDSDILLQEFVTPILIKNEIDFSKFFDRVNSKDYGIEFDVIRQLLHDFIDFVCDCKGHKVGVGDCLIEKFIRDMCIYGK